jgi:hypothetical protein
MPQAEIAEVMLRKGGAYNFVNKQLRMALRVFIGR